MADAFAWVMGGLTLMAGVLLPPLAILVTLRSGEARPTGYRPVTREAEPVQFWLHIAVYLLLWVGGLAAAVTVVLELLGHGNR